MFQAYPASWTTPPTMDFPYDGVYTFPSALSQTLCELDIDNSIHKLFDGLPEISEPDGHYTVAGAVTVASSSLFPSTPPAQRSRPSSMGGTGSLIPNNPVHELAATTLTRTRSATHQQPVLVRSELPLPPVTVVANRKVGRGARKAAKGPAAGRGNGSESKVTPALPSGKRVLEATPLPTSQAPLFIPAVARMEPKILPAIAADPSAVEANERVHPHNLGLRAQPVCLQSAPQRSRTCSRPDASSLPMANTRTQKTRYFDKVEHIVRERWRRDDMAGKFLALESLLPPSSKRDRSTIVEDSMKLVKSLQHRKEEARKRRTVLQQAVKTQAQPGVKLSQIMQKIGSLAVMNPPQQQSGGLLQSAPVPPSKSTSDSSRVLSGTKRGLELEPGLIDSSSVVPKFLSDCVHRFYMHSDLSTGDIVIEMICEHVPNFHSSLLKSMDSLGLEVLRCNLTKTLNKLICNITVKPFPSSASVTSSSRSNIMEGLSSAFRKE